MQQTTFAFHVAYSLDIACGIRTSPNNALYDAMISGPRLHVRKEKDRDSPTDASDTLQKAPCEI